MFIHFIGTTGYSLLRICSLLYKLTVCLFAHVLCNRLSRRAGVRFKLAIRYGIYQPEILLIAPQEDPQDWQPQFHFAVRADKRGVLLYSLKFPARLRQHGLGSFCVKWLKCFCLLFGLRFIVLGCYPEAVNFWRKMNFIATVYEDWKLYWH